jgi:mannose-6-phosphate isomerase class I
MAKNLFTDTKDKAGFYGFNPTGSVQSSLDNGAGQKDFSPTATNVIPPDASKGKTEMWYVVDNNNNTARLRSGLKRSITPAEYEAMVADNTICEALAEYNVNCGDVFFLPAGRIHSIGAGCFLVEIQQTSNITYRIYDYNRTDKNGNH